MKSLLSWPCTHSSIPVSVQKQGPTITPVSVCLSTCLLPWKVSLRRPIPLPHIHISVMPVPALPTPGANLHLGCYAASSNRTRATMTGFGGQQQAGWSPVCSWLGICASRLQKPLCWDMPPQPPKGTHIGPKAQGLFRGPEARERQTWVKDSNQEGRRDRDKTSTTTAALPTSAGFKVSGSWLRARPETPSGQLWPVFLSLAPETASFQISGELPQLMKQLAAPGGKMYPKLEKFIF